MVMKCPRHVLNYSADFMRSDGHNVLGSSGSVGCYHIRLGDSSGLVGACGRKPYSVREPASSRRLCDQGVATAPANMRGVNGSPRSCCETLKVYVMPKISRSY